MSAHELYTGLATVGGLLLVLGMLAGPIHEKGILSEPLFALLARVLIGPAAFAAPDPAQLGAQARILEEAALVTLGDALRIPEGWSRPRSRSGRRASRRCGGWEASSSSPPSWPTA